MSNSKANTGQINEACGPWVASLTRLPCSFGGGAWRWGRCECHRRHAQPAAQRTEDNVWSSPKLPVACGLWPVADPHPALSLSPVSSLATCLTCANTEVDVIKLTPIFQPFAPAAALTRIASGGIGMCKWVGGGRGKTKSPAPLHRSVKLG